LVEQPVYARIAAYAERQDAVERSVEYIRQSMSRFLKKNERVLICFPQKENACCRILEEAVLACGCTPVWLGEDRRWITLLKTAFTSKSNCIVGPPLMLLGLSKVAKHMGTPLFARNVLLSGYPSPDWVVNAIERGLDCKAWGCYDPGIGPVIAGFSCGKSSGVHIWDAEYGVDIVDEQGNVLAEGETGFVVLYPRQQPSLRFETGDRGRLETASCACGCKAARLVDIDLDKKDYASLSEMGESLHYWSSILDCRVERGECGLELEAVVFQGEKLPKFPNCAKMVLRPWQPDMDIPFDHHNVVKNKLIYGFDH